MGRDKGGRCLALNRPLSRFCRRCGWEFAPGWAASAWGLDIVAESGEGPPVLDLKPIAFVDLTGRIATPSWGSMPPELVEIGGRIWIGGGDGRQVLVDPFSGKVADLDASRVGPAGAVASGPWLLLYGSGGVEALNLLAIDDPWVGGSRPITSWVPPDGWRRASRPVFLQSGPKAEPFAAWLAAGPEGLRLQWTTLPVVSGDRPIAGEVVLPSADRGGPEFGPGERPAAVAVAPSERGDGLLIRTSRSLWLIPGPIGPDADLPRAVRLFDRDDPGQRLPGLVHVPSPADGPSSGGSVMMACVDPTGARRPALEVLNLVGETAYLQPFDWSGVPLESTSIGGDPEVLCLEGDALVLRNLYGQVRNIASNDGLAQLNRWSIGGRYAAGSCHEVFETRKRWMTHFVDLKDGLSVGMLTNREPSGRPIIVGPYVLTVEDRPDGEVGCGLAIRRIVPRSVLRQAVSP